MDGVAKYDWRDLRTKLLDELELHRSGKLKPRRPKYEPAVHFDQDGKSLCGKRSIYDPLLADNLSKVTCYHCHRKSQSKVDSSSLKIDSSRFTEEKIQEAFKEFKPLFADLYPEQVIMTSQYKSFLKGVEWALNQLKAAQ